jgi:dolichol-phosphate mannosyltransferase
MKNTKLYGVARNNKKEVKRFGKFAIVGISGLVVDYFILNLLTYFLGVSKWPAIGIAFTCAAINNFVWNRVWVYPESREVKKRKQLPVFFTVNAVGLGINWLIFFLLNQPMDNLMAAMPISLVARHHLGISLNVTKGIAAVVVMFWNFAINRLVTFRSVSWQTNTGAPLPQPETDDERVDSAL